MWCYDNISRADFEKVKGIVEDIMIKLGAEIFKIYLPYEQKTTTFTGTFEEIFNSKRPVYTYKGEYFRIDEVLFSKKPFIVIECGDMTELLNNTMEDAEPFPYDLPYEELINEVKYSLGIESYPKM